MHHVHVVGAQRPLKTADLYGIAPRDNPGWLARRLKREWDVRKRRTESWWALVTYASTSSPSRCAVKR
jgi:hypothetical protein